MPSDNPARVLSDGPFMKLFARSLFERYRDRFYVIGVTGSKGKSTTCRILGQLLDAVGRRVGVCTAERSIVRGQVFDRPNTLRGTWAFLEHCEAASVDHIVVELTSNDLSLGVHRCLPLRAGIFTNIGQSHINDHGNLRNYISVKKRLFRAIGDHGTPGPSLAVVNRDDAKVEHFRRAVGPTVRLASYGFLRPMAGPGDGRSGLVVTDFDETSEGIRLSFDGVDALQHVRIPGVFGRFNAYNTAAAAACALALGVPPTTIETALGDVEVPDGRFDVVVRGSGDFPSIVVDYAHTPESLEAAIAASRVFALEGRVIVVFGSGGERRSACADRWAQ